MFEFHGREPGEFLVGVFITKPVDKVEEFARAMAVDLGVSYFGDLIL